MTRCSASRNPRRKTGSSPNWVDFLYRHRGSGPLAAGLGRWVEEGGPRKAMFTADCAGVAASWSARRCRDPQYLAGLFRLWVLVIRLASLHLARLHADQMVSRPAGHGDRHAIMGFGGAAFIASPLSVALMRYFSTPTHVGVAETSSCWGRLFLFHDGGRRDRAPAAARLGAAGLCPPAQPKKLVTRATSSFIRR